MIWREKVTCMTGEERSQTDSEGEEEDREFITTRGLKSGVRWTL